MKRHCGSAWYRWLLPLMLAAFACGGARASSVSADYYAISSSDPSYNNMCCGTHNNEVLDSLGPDHLPLYNTAYSGAPPNPADLYSTLSGQEITWWSPSLNSNVTHIATGTVSLPFNQTSNFYAYDVNPSYPNNDSAYGLAAHFYGTLTAPTTETISFSIGADDSAFAYLDGSIVCDLGGVHPYTPGTCVTPFNISAGNHTLDLFFVDLNQVQSGLYFDVTTSGVTVAPPVPEPESYAMMLSGIALLGVFARRRKQSKT